jgi:hypothetical protein
MSFTEKLHVKIANNPQSPQCQTEAEKKITVSFPTPLFQKSPENFLINSMAVVNFVRTWSRSHFIGLWLSIQN